MAIKMRTGNEADFEPSKMIPGEWAVSLDTKYVRMCFAAGVVVRMATYDSFEADMEKIQTILSEVKTVQEAVERIQDEINNTAITVENYVASTQEYSNISNIYAMQSKRYSEAASNYANNAYNESERAKEYAENAASVTNIQIATMKRAGIVKGGENYITEDGALTLTKRTTNTTLSNSYDGGIKINQIFGRSEQKTTTGAQLFDANGLSLGTNTSLKISEDGYAITAKGGAGGFSTYSEIELDVEAFAGKTLYFKLDSVSSQQLDASLIQLFVSFNVNPGYRQYNISNNEPQMEIRIPNSNVTKIAIRIYTNKTSKALEQDNTVEVKGLILSLTDSTWEQYTGGIASPNPDYPQEVNSVVMSEIKVSGKNRLKNVRTSATLNGVTFTVNKDKSITVSGTASSDATFSIDTAFDKKGNYIMSGCPSGGSAATYFMVAGGAGYDYGNGLNFSVGDVSRYIAIAVKAGVKMNNLTFYPMIRESDVADDTYEPYQEHSIILSDNTTLNGIPATRDGNYTDANGQQWVCDIKDYEHGKNVQSVGMHVFDGTETFSMSLSTTGGGKYFLWNTDKDIKLVKNGEIKTNYFCSHLREYTSNYLWANDTDGFSGAISSAPIRLRLSSLGIETVAELKAKLKEWHDNGNPMALVYAKSVPIESDISDKEMLAAIALKSFNAVTHLFTNSDVQMIIDVEYGTSKVGGYALESWNTAKSNKINIKLLNNAILSLGGNV